MWRLNLFLQLCIFTNVQIQGSQESNNKAYVKLTDKIRIVGEVEKTFDNAREFEAFKGIRYAKAPLGTLRFQEPVPEEYEESVIDAMSYGSSCPQMSSSGKYIGNEDCLFLNIFVPKERKGPLPVMVFIHGGGFTEGESSEYAPDYLMNKNNVILVTINYRLGALGFLSLGDDSISGNMGIKDQFESLKWIKRNIKSFGGDENSITIFGCSAGGVSILSLMMAAHKVPDLFHRAISQSGPMIDAPFMHLTHDPSYYALLFGNEMGCDSENSIDLSKCLREKDVHELIKKQDMFQKFMTFPNPWKPVADFEYASKPLFSMGFMDLIRHGLMIHVPLLMGGTSEEGAIFSQDFFKNDEEKFQELNENFDITGATLLMGIDEADVTDEDSATVNIINLEYLDSDNVTYSSENIVKLVQMLTDVHFLGPIDKQVQLFANSSHSSVFYYNYRYKGSHSTSIRGLDLGASHSDELFLLFKMKDVLLSTEDKKMSDSLIDYWTSFAINGSPDSNWSPVSNTFAPKYVIIDSFTSTIVKRESYFNERMAFISSTNDIIKSYRHFDLESHPAIISAMEREVEEDEDDEKEPSKDEL